METDHPSGRPQGGDRLLALAASVPFVGLGHALIGRWAMAWTCLLGAAGFLTAYLVLAHHTTLIAMVWLLVGVPVFIGLAAFDAYGRRPAGRGVSFTRLLVFVVCQAALIVTAITLNPLTVALIRGESMQPTLMRNDLVIGRRTTPLCPRLDIPPGTVVALRAPVRPGEAPLLGKRVIAGTGDNVRLDGRGLWINQRRITSDIRPDHAQGPFAVESFDGRHRWSVLAQPGATMPFGVPWQTSAALRPGQVVLLGDNRPFSIDSRRYGPVAAARVELVIERVLLSSYHLSWMRPLSQPPRDLCAR